MTNTHTLSRRIVAAIDPDGTRWPEWCITCPTCRMKTYKHTGAGYLSCTTCDEVFSPNRVTGPPDLAQPCNLHLLLEVADGLGRCTLEYDHEHACRLKGDRFSKFGYASTRSLAILAAVCAALGIDTTQETTHAD